MRRFLLGLFVALVVFFTHRLAQAQATCKDVENVSWDWYKLVEVLDKKVEKHGNYDLPRADAERFARGKLKLLPRTLAIVKTLETISSKRWQRFAAYLMTDLKLLSEIDHKDGDDWEDDSNAVWRISDQLDRVGKLCDGARSNRLGG